MGFVQFTTDIDKDVDINVLINFDVLKTVTTSVDIDDCLATAEASADAVGSSGNFLAETETFAQCTDFGAFAFSQSIAASSPDDGF